MKKETVTTQLLKVLQYLERSKLSISEIIALCKKNHLDATDLGFLLNASNMTIYRWRLRGELKPVNYNGQQVYLWTDVLKFICS